MDGRILDVLLKLLFLSENQLETNLTNLDSMCLHHSHMSLMSKNGP